MGRSDPHRARRLLPYLQISPAWLVLILFFLLPLVIMLLVSFAQKGIGHGGLKPIEDMGEYIRSGAFFSNYARSIDPLYLKIYWRSLWMAVLTTVLCLLVSYPIAYYIAVVASRRWKNTLLALVVIPFWTSFLVRTYAWMLILRTEGLINTTLMHLGWIDKPMELLYSEFAVMIGLVYGELPFMILPLYASLEKLDLTLLEASKDLGANHFETFRRVTFPLTMPGIVAGIVLVFIPSIGQFVVSDLLGGAKSMLAGNLIQNQFAVANKPFGSAIAFELTAVVLVLLMAYAWYAKRKGHETML